MYETLDFKAADRRSHKNNEAREKTREKKLFSLTSQLGSLSVFSVLNLQFHARSKKNRRCRHSFEPMEERHSRSINSCRRCGEHVIFGCYRVLLIFLISLSFKLRNVSLLFSVKRTTIKRIRIPSHTIVW